MTFKQVIQAQRRNQFPNQTIKPIWMLENHSLCDESRHNTENLVENVENNNNEYPPRSKYTQRGD